MLILQLNNKSEHLFYTAIEANNVKINPLLAMLTEHCQLIGEWHVKDAQPS